VSSRFNKPDGCQVFFYKQNECQVTFINLMGVKFSFINLMSVSNTLDVCQVGEYTHATTARTRGIEPMSKIA